MNKILYLVKKEFKQIFRTREMIAIIFGIPLAQLLILGYTITNEVKNISLLIADQDDSYISHEIVRAFGNTDRFKIIGFETDRRKLEKAVQNWEAQMLLIIPSGFGEKMDRREKPDIQLIMDGLDGNSAGIALGYAQGILMDFSRKYFSNPNETAVLRRIHLVQMNDRMWYNANLNNAQYMIPGLVVVLLTVISMMLSAVNLVREKEIGTLEQLMVTPLKRHQLLFGKILPFLILTFIEMIVVLLFAQLIFGITVAGSYRLLAGLSFIFLFTTLGLGIFVSAITSTQQQAMFISWFMMVFMLLMSGFFIPIENMPPLLQKITYLNPMRYFMYIIRDIVQKGSTFTSLLQDVIPMTIYGIFIFLLAVLNFQKRLA
jgi:ABC-2 type transport system permease protein